MKLRLAITLVTLLFVTNAISAQTPAVKIEKITIKTKVAQADYDGLLKKLKAGDMDIDFARLRLAYTMTPDYAPYGGSELRGQMGKAVNEGKFGDALKHAQKMLETNYVDLHGHFYAALAYKNLDKAKESETHTAILKKLLDAIQQYDGLTESTAMISIGISEQYFVMNWLGYERQSKGLVNSNGSIFDVHTSYNKETKDTRKFYFNIDKVFGKF